MPRIRFRARDHDVVISCPEGANLRMVLLRARLPLYTKAARALHCRGHGSCGTCAVRVEGPVSEPSAAERARLRVAPFRKRGGPEASGLRLACQCKVLGDLTVTKHEGFWGQHPEDPG